MRRRGDCYRDTLEIRSRCESPSHLARPRHRGCSNLRGGEKPGAAPAPGVPRPAAAAAPGVPGAGAAAAPRVPAHHTLSPEPHTGHRFLPLPGDQQKRLKKRLKKAYLLVYFRQNSLTSGKKPVPRGECPRRSHLPGVSPGADGACLWQPVWGITCVARACRGERRCLPPPDNSSESLNIECYRLLRLQSRLQTTRVNRNRRESAGCFCNVPGLLQGSSRVSPGFTPFPDIEALPGSDISRYALFTPDRQR